MINRMSWNNNSDGVQSCMVNVCGWGDFFTDDCMGCYADMGECMNNNCYSECSDGWMPNDDCDECMNSTFDSTDISSGSCEGDFSSCSGVYYGCNDDSACNYDSDANTDAQNCNYPEPDFDCDGNCTAELDCNGVCNGSADLDECGVCNGSGPEPGFDCEGNQNNYVHLSFANATDSSIDVMYESDNNIGGMQFHVNGVV